MPMTIMPGTPGPNALTAAKLRFLADMAELAAVQDSKVGAKFRGGFKAAEDTGYPDDPERRLFATVYSCSLPADGVLVDDDHVVVAPPTKVEQRLKLLTVSDLTRLLHTNTTPANSEPEQDARVSICRELKRRGVLQPEHPLIGADSTRAESISLAVVEHLETKVKDLEKRLNV